MTTNFKKCDQLIARIKEQLSSYHAAGMLDEGMFYRWIKEILAKLNVPAYSPVHRIEEIEGGVMEIPDDLYQIWAIWKYHEYHEVPSPKEIKTNRITQRIGEVKCADNCSDCQDVCEVEQKYDTLIVRHFVDYSKLLERTYKKGELLTLKNFKVDRCDRQSPSLHNNSSLEVTMDNKNFYFNFEKGSIYIQYMKMMMDEDGLPMIPDIVQIEQAIEDYIIYKTFQKFYYNGEGDFLRMKQEAEVTFNRSYSIAVNWVKMPTASSLINYAHLLRNKYKVFEF